MLPRPDRRLTAARGVTAAGIATFATTVGHATAQHALPSAWVVAVAFALAAPVCVALAGRRLSVARLAIAVAASQAAFHLLLRLDFTGASPEAAGHHGAVEVAGLAADTGAAAHAMSPGMLVGHALAAVATVIVLATGERAVRAPVALALRPFRALIAALAVVVAPVARIVVGGPDGIRPVLVPGAPVGRRGPPVAA